MMPLIVIGILVGLPLILSFVLRVNAGVIFLALCTGSVISDFVSGDAAQLFNSFFPHASNLSNNVIEIVLLLLPAALTIVFMRRSMTGTKSLINILPAAASGLLTALLVVPLLSAGTRYNITKTHVWSLLEQFQSVIIGAGAFVSLLVLWGSKPKHADKKHHK